MKLYEMTQEIERLLLLLSQDDTEEVTDDMYALLAELADKRDEKREGCALVYKQLIAAKAANHFQKGKKK